MLSHGQGRWFRRCGGRLPKYQTNMGHDAKVVMPMYRTKFLYQNEWVIDFKGRTNLADWWFDYTIIKEKHNTLGFHLYLVDIHGLLDREKIYGYSDDIERFTAFQIAVVNWLSHWQKKPDIVHCHDHHTGLIPFMMRYCYDYNHLANVPSVFTIHNAQYQGWMGWDKSHLHTYVGTHGNEACLNGRTPLIHSHLP